MIKQTDLPPCGLGLTRWLIAGLREHSPPQCGVRQGTEGTPQCPPDGTSKRPSSSLPVPCLSPAWGRERSPRSKVLSLVPGTTPVSSSSETERSHLVICHQAPANRKTQIVSSLQTICK